MEPGLWEICYSDEVPLEFFLRSPEPSCFSFLGYYLGNIQNKPKTNKLKANLGFVLALLLTSMCGRSLFIILVFFLYGIELIKTFFCDSFLVRYIEGLNSGFRDTSLVCE